MNTETTTTEAEQEGGRVMNYCKRCYNLGTIGFFMKKLSSYTWKTEPCNCKAGKETA